MPILVATLIFSFLIAVFLTALGTGGYFWQNLVVSQCIGLGIYACSQLTWRLPWVGAWRGLGIAAGVVLGLVGGSALGGLLIGYPGLLQGSKLVTTLVAGAMFGAIGSGFVWLRQRNALLEGQLQARELARLEAEKQSLAAQLRMLQAQIEPHFLFNSLANVAALIDADPKLASRLLDALIVYLRSSLARTRAEGGTLADEVALLTAYLDVLKIRMGERLAYAFEIAPELLAHAFPPMLLQPLVENAIRHGLEPKVAGGRVTVSARRQGDRLQISVNDDGLGFAETPGEGIGVANIRARLAALYGPTASLELSSGVGAGVTATMSVPVGGPA
ncbi:MAG: histidine kinase [Rhodocyclales bacterium]|nr:histidine kinase [Rhodocyclales bacterium]